MCYSGACSYEDNCGHCRKPRYAICPGNEDYNLEDDVQEEKADA